MLTLDSVTAAAQRSAVAIFCHSSAPSNTGCYEFKGTDGYGVHEHGRAVYYR
jgi:hypothetical protein